MNVSHRRFMALSSAPAMLAGMDEAPRGPDGPRVLVVDDDDNG
jgi:hypothetical protein